MENAQEHLCYFNSDRIAKVGDTIATCRHGHGKIIEIIHGGYLVMRNIITGELFDELTSDCDFLE